MIRRQDVSAPCCKLLAAALLALSGLTACGSQMDDIGEIEPRDEIPAPAGIYEGQLVSTTNGTTEDVVGLMDTTKGRERLLVFTEKGELVVGGKSEIFTESKQLSWTAKMYRKVTTTAPDEETGVDVTTTTTKVTPLLGQGGFVAEKSVQLSYAAADGSDFGSLTLNYEKLRYVQRSNLETIAGRWGSEDEFGIPKASYTISPDGQFSGKGEDGCTYQGNLSIIDLHYNLYYMSLTQLCGTVSIPAAGLATLNQSSGEVDMLQAVAVANQTAVVFLLRPLP